MTDNVSQLKEFYDTAKGHKQCRGLRAKILALWPNTKNEKIIGFGFTLPYLPVLSANNKVLALMPQNIGAIDLHQGILSVMADEEQLPIRHETIDKILAAHALENAQDVGSTIAEFWRILKPYGKVIFIFEEEKFSLERLVSTLVVNKFSVKSRSRCCAPVAILDGFMGKIMVVEAQKLVFAPRGRTQKIVKSIWDKIARPKPALEPQ